MKSSNLKVLINNAIICAIYVVLSLISQPLSFGMIQFRIAECLVVLCFFNKGYIFGVSIGCLIVNFMSPLGLFDVLFGTIATILGCVAIMFIKKLLLGCLAYSLINSLIVGLEMMFLTENTNFWVNFGFITLGEVTCVCILGYILIMILGKKIYFLDLIQAKQNRDFRW